MADPGPASESNAFFVARPRHILCAAAVALEHPEADNRLYIVERLSSADNQEYVAALADWSESPFSRVVRLGRTGRGRPVAKLLRLCANRRTVEREIAAQRPDRVFVCNDHLAEIQYGLHLAKRLRPGVRGIYIEDGSGAYGYEKSRTKRRFDGIRRWIKGLSRRLVHGWWWQKVVILGTSRWIDEAMVAFPELASPALRNRPLHRLSSAMFSTPAFTALARGIARRFRMSDELLARAEVIMAFAQSQSVRHIPAYGPAMSRLCTSLADAGISLLAKFHPREESPEFVPLPRDRVGVLPTAMPFEIALLLLVDRAVTIVGGVSTAVISTRWLLPRARLIAVQLGPVGGTLMDTLRALGVEIASDPDAVARDIAASWASTSGA